MPPTLYLIDGHALAYRMYFALTAGSASQRWQTSKGVPTAGIYGFSRELMRIFEQEKPDYLAVAFDTGKTFRDEVFPEYKATRAKMPDDLRVQIGHIRQVVDAFNIPRLEMEGYEADDVLGSVARWGTKQGLGVKIITGDRDLLQLVEEGIIVYLAGDDKNFITPADVVEKLHVRPDQVVDYKSLVGDKSDNIPGVPGVGEKTTESLLAKFETLDGIYSHLDEIEPRWRSKLEAGKESAYMSHTLAAIRTDLPVKVDLEQARIHAFDADQVRALFQEFEFRTLIDKLNKLTGFTPTETGTQQLDLFSGQGVTAAVSLPGSNSVEGKTAGAQGKGDPTMKVIVVDSPALLEELHQALASAALIAFDTETTSVDEMTAGLVGISLAVREEEGWYIPVGHRQGAQLPLEQVLATLRGPMTDARIPKVGHHLKYDFIMLARFGLRVSPLGFDAMLAEWMLDPDSRNLGLKNLASARLNASMTHIEDLIGTGKNQRSMADVSISDVAPYAAADAVYTLRLKPRLETELKKFPKLQDLFLKVEVPLISVLADMEMSGIALDIPFFTAFSKELKTNLAALEIKIYQAAGKTFNINSTQQLSQILFGTLRLEPPDKGKKTSSGHYSTAAGVLEELRGKHPVVDMILEYRELAKLKSTYVDALPLEAHPEDGRVHTSFSQTGAVTGRLASSDPNLQNIPTRTDLGRRVRRGFIAAPGNVLVSLDYSQIELRIVAHMANDKAMLEAFRRGQDIHAATAAAIYNKPIDKVTKEQRRDAKAINFGLIYGMSAYGLAQTTGLTLAESEDFVKAYFQQFPGVKKHLDGIRLEAAENGYVETMLGRRRYFPNLKGGLNIAMKKREEREAINAPIQGTAADIMKIAMVRIPPALQQAGLHARMLLQVHDELVLECPKEELENSVKVVRRVMEDAYPLSIPLSTDARWGVNWEELKPLA
jgi:DNA polymerase I